MELIKDRVLSSFTKVISDSGPVFGVQVTSWQGQLRTLSGTFSWFNVFDNRVWETIVPAARLAGQIVGQVNTRWHRKLRDGKTKKEQLLISCSLFFAASDHHSQLLNTPLFNQAPFPFPFPFLDTRSGFAFRSASRLSNRDQHGMGSFWT